MKKLLVVLLALLMVLGFAGCGEYKPPVDVGGNPTITDPGGTKPPNTGTPADTSFTVSLYDVKTNRPFTKANNIFALWNDLESNAIYKAQFDETGVATIEGLDGDYAVTLSALPEGYTYNPNNNIATNDDRNIVIYMYQINKINGTHRQNAGGENWLLNNINSTRGAFRATLKNPGDIVRFYYTTGNYGEYSIESIIDTTANVINPVLEVYDASSVFINMGSRAVYDGGGASNTYTKNFRFERTMDRGWVFIFCIRAESLNENAYPIDIDFIIDKDGELTPGAVYEMAVANEAKPYTFPSGSFKYVASLDETGNNILNGKLFRLDDREEVNGQPNPEYGYYRFYDEETQTYGGTLFTRINRDWEFTSTLTGKGFLDGIEGGYVSCRFFGYNYSDFLKAYAQYVNGDGVYPVTEELKNFLMNFSKSQSYFSDGSGWAETEGHYNASEKNQWLFSCGYYNR